MVTPLLWAGDSSVLLRKRGLSKRAGKCYDFRHQPSYEIPGSSHWWPVLFMGLGYIPVIHPSNPSHSPNILLLSLSLVIDVDPPEEDYVPCSELKDLQFTNVR